MDTDIAVTFNFMNLSSDASRVNTRLNSSTFQGVVEFKYLLPSDRGVAFSCASTVQAVENGVPVVNPTATHTLQIEGMRKIHLVALGERGKLKTLLLYTIRVNLLISNK